MKQKERFCFFFGAEDSNINTYNLESGDVALQPAQRERHVARYDGEQIVRVHAHVHQRVDDDCVR